MVNYASTPSGKKDMSIIRRKMSHNFTGSMNDSNRSGGVSFKSKVASEHLKVETPILDYKKELDELKHYQLLKMANLKDLMLKMS